MENKNKLGIHFTWKLSGWTEILGFATDGSYQLILIWLYHQFKKDPDSDTHCTLRSTVLFYSNNYIDVKIWSSMQGL